MKSSQILLGLMLLLFLPGQINAQKKDIFVRKIDFALKTLNADESENQFFLTLQFNRDVHYKFIIKNHLEGGIGEAVVEIYDGDKLAGTNLIKGKYFPKFMFECEKTGFYDVVVRFKNNTTGNSEVNIFMIP